MVQVSQYNLAHHGDWWSCKLDVLNTAFVLDYVFSDSAKRSWDNNAQQVSHCTLRMQTEGLSSRAPAGLLPPPPPPPLPSSVGMSGRLQPLKALS